MKLRSKSKCGWGFAPYHFRRKSAPRVCMLSDVQPEERSPGYAPVYLNVYDLTPVNGYVYWAGFGIFHTGVQVHGVEYAFGAHDYPTSGVFEVEPRQCPGFKFRKSMFMGMTRLDPLEARDFMEHQSAFYTGDSYDLLVMNCNHFCDDICHKLTGRRIPKWVNRLAKIGSACKCILPDSLKATKVRHDSGELQICNEKRKLRNTLNCKEEFGEAEQDVSICSMSLNSHYKGCLSSWEQMRTAAELED